MPNDVPVLWSDPELPDGAVVERAGVLLAAGALVAIPTETVYGLAANALDRAAVLKIFAAKGRPSFNPLIVHLADVGDIEHVARDIPPAARVLAAAFWPGPLSLVVPRGPSVPSEVTAGLDSVAVRVPSLPLTRAIIRAAGVPLAAPSANRSNEVSPTRAQHVTALGDRVSLIVDAGPCTVGIESTVVDCTTAPYTLLRPGGVPRAAIEALVGPLRLRTHADEGESRTSPGMMSRHYAPSVPLYLFAEHESPRVLGEVRRERASGEKIALITTGHAPYAAEATRIMPGEPGAYARELYAMLHELDAGGFRRAYVELVPADPSWDAVRDRLYRAAHRE